MKKLIAIIVLVILSPVYAQMVTTDPLFPKQWALKNSGQLIYRDITDFDGIISKGIAGLDINWIDTKNIETQNKELIVAVIDSGVDIEHPDLKERIWFNEKLCGHNPPNIKNLPCRGFNFLENNLLLNDDIGHGTHVAGIIAAVRNNLGVAGAADPRVKIMPLKVINSEVKSFVHDGKVLTNVIADAILFAVKNGASVINLSLGWPKLIDLEKVRKAFDFAEENNVTIIAATGNNSKDLPLFPCAYENVICVGGVDNRGQMTDFTNYGAKVDVLAPSEWIVSTYPQKIESRVLRIKNYEIKNGSSQAAPFVSAAVANLRLLHPNLKNDQIKSLLFRSSSKRALNETHARFVKYGMLDMKKLLELANVEEEEAFVHPLLKSLTEIKFNSKSKIFDFKIGFKNLSKVEFSGEICAKIHSDSIRLNNECFKVAIGSYGKIEITVYGELSDLSLDSHTFLELNIGKRSYKTALVFSRILNNDPELKSFPVANATFEAMAILRPGQRFSRLIRVFDKHRQLSYPEYFFLDPKNQTDEKTVVSLLSKKSGQFDVHKIELPKLTNIIAIFRKDINLDGKLDYFLYTLSKKKDEIHFFSFTEDLNPLFGDNSLWKLTLSVFGGLPTEGGLERFEWIKLKNPVLGNILLPSMYRNYSMPEEDNSKIISERILGNGFHQYYLNPIVDLKNKEVKLELRVVDSIAMIKSLYKQLDIRGHSDAKTLTLLKAMPQTKEELAKGTFKSLLMVTEDDTRKFYQASLTLENNQHHEKLVELAGDDEVSGSLIYPILNTESGNIQDESVFTALRDRSTAEFLVKGPTNIKQEQLLQETWTNPILSLMAVFQNTKNERTYFVESRSTIVALKDNGDKSSLLIYRDSSFPGQDFAETFTPVLVGDRPGIYVNSTLIFGERLYTMVDTKDKGLIRPLSLSVEVPAGCVILWPETLERATDYHYAFLCTAQGKEASLKFLPMSSL